MNGKSSIVLFAAEPFFLCRGNELSVYDERRRTVVIKSGYAQDRLRHQNKE